MISLESLRRNGNGSDTELAGAWILVDGLGGLPPGTHRDAEVAGSQVVICRFEGDLFAYGNRCPSCDFVWHEGFLEGKILVCAGCGERYDVRKAGRSVRGRPSIWTPARC